MNVNEMIIITAIVIVLFEWILCINGDINIIIINIIILMMILIVLALKN